MLILINIAQRELNKMSELALFEGIGKVADWAV